MEKGIWVDAAQTEVLLKNRPERIGLLLKNRSSLTEQRCLSLCFSAFLYLQIIVWGFNMAENSHHNQIQKLFFFFSKDLFIYFKLRDNTYICRERGGEIDRYTHTHTYMAGQRGERGLPSTDSLPRQLQWLGPGWGRPKPGSRSFIQFSHLGARAHWAIPCCFPRILTWNQDWK